MMIFNEPLFDLKWMIFKEFVVYFKNNTIICHKKITEMLVLVWLIHRKKTLIFFLYFFRKKHSHAVNG